MPCPPKVQTVVLCWESINNLAYSSIGVVSSDEPGESSGPRGGDPWDIRPGLHGPLSKLSEEPQELAKRLTIKRLIAT